MRGQLMHGLLESDDEQATSILLAPDKIRRVDELEAFGGVDLPVYPNIPSRSRPSRPRRWRVAGRGEPKGGLEDWPRHRERGVRAVRTGLEEKRQAGTAKIIDGREIRASRSAHA